MVFEFFRLRFMFQAVEPVRFPSEPAGNTIRGALGYALRRVACSCGAGTHQEHCPYASIFEPRDLSSRGPSGFAELPRPFVLRTRHLDGRTFQPREAFCFDLHLFEVRRPWLSHFGEAFSRIASEGIGIAHGRANLVTVEQLDTGDRVLGAVWNGNRCSSPFAPASVALAAADGEEALVHIQFLTPTELKIAGGLARRPDFAVLFARVRDRISMLQALYGSGPMDVDFRSLGDRAAQVEMTGCKVEAVRSERRSSRTGQTHPLGGFTGEAEYRGRVSEFLPYLRAARWTGVGRQTVWGKGEIAIAS